MNGKKVENVIRKIASVRQKKGYSYEYMANVLP